jgi:hypothetical protein
MNKEQLFGNKYIYILYPKLGQDYQRYLIILSKLAKNNREACMQRCSNINSHCQYNPRTEALDFNLSTSDRKINKVEKNSVVEKARKKSSITLQTSP